ncbi:hypothetical protein JCM8547_007014 [Rhodosporidiobolus lusitaniae]
MPSATLLLLSYLLGGLTFLPLLLASFLGLLFYSSPVVPSPTRTGIPVLPKEGEADDAEPVNVYRAGWLTVRRTYEPQKESVNDGTYVGMLASGYRSFLDNRSRDPRRSKPKDKFYGVLKQSVLFLYESNEMQECWAAIEVGQHEVVIWPEGNVDGELFVKRTAVCLRPRREEKEKEEEGEGGKEKEKEKDEEDEGPGKPLPWFLFVQVNSDKEDWYHSLQLSSRLSSPSSAHALASDRALFSPTDMARLIDSIDAQPDSIPMRWFNALLGRVFLSTYRTSSLENYLTSRLVRKLKRVKLPSVLSEVKVKEVNVGTSLPLFSRPMLKELTTEGDASMEVHVAFVGAIRVTIETVASFSLGSRQYSVRLVLAVVLRELEGQLLVKMKRPPSNRVWFGFTKMPSLRIEIEPVVSTRQVKWSLVTGPIESRIRELIAESLVLPHMDDLSFFDTTSAPLLRGGIYGAFLRSSETAPSSSSPAAEAPSSAEEGEEVGEKDGKAEEDLTGEVVPSVDSASEKREKTGESSVRQRIRRRRSSEGEQNPLDLAPSTSISTSTDSSSSGTKRSTSTPRAATAIEKDKDKTPSVKSSSSVSSGLAGLSASIQQWRESRASPSPSPSTGTSAVVGGGEAKEGDGEGKKRTSSWFAKSSSFSSSSLASPAGAGASASMPASVSGSPGAGAPAPGEKDAEGEEVSARKLREVLAKRAGEREREREREEREEEEERRRREGEVVGEGKEGREKRRMELPPTPPSKSNLALTAPAPAEAEAGKGAADTKEEDQEEKVDEPVVEPLVLNLREPPPSSSIFGAVSVAVETLTPPAALTSAPILPPRNLTDSPRPVSSSSAASTKSTHSRSASSLHSTGSTESTTPTTLSHHPAAPPALPDRPPKTLPTPLLPYSSSSTASLPSHPAPSALDLPPPPPPPPRRPSHAPSPSLDAPSSSTASTLLASWRTRAAPLLNQGEKEGKEALEKAKDLLGRRWGAGWGAKRAGAGKVDEQEEEGKEGKEEGKEEKEGGSYFGPASPVVPQQETPASGARPIPAPSLPPRTPDRHPSSTSTRSHRSSSLSYSLSSSPGSSPFLPPSSSPVAAPKLSQISASPSSSSHVSTQPTVGGGGIGMGAGTATGGYGARTMQLPGMYSLSAGDQKKRERVREDHLGGGAGGVPVGGETGKEDGKDGVAAMRERKVGEGKAGEGKAGEGEKEDEGK